ncbi:MAG: hypothetical protein LQ339_005932 [Xanthoria mediterranea]|nr:MAG: hypothetical protein LQ339_005932 [Xanthoria mediterranea]
MSSPFGRRAGDAGYSGIAPDLMKVIEKFNEAADRVAEQTQDCSICLNILDTPEGSGQPPRASQTNGTVGTSRLSIITLRCGHRFHEQCLMTWLSPILYPSMEHGLGAVATVLDDRSIIIDLMGQLPLGSNERATVERMAAAPLGRHTVDEIFARVRQGTFLFDHVGADGLRARRRSRALTDRDRFTQDLYAINPFIDRLHTREVFVSDVLGKEPDPRSCPYCRQPANLGRLDHHADIIQLIRARLRLTNLAYQTLKFQRTPREENQRISITKFLQRRSNDNTILGIDDVNKWSRTVRPKVLFKQARLTLRETAFQYLKHLNYLLSSAERLRICQLVAFYESFQLKWVDVLSFFDAREMLDQEWEWEPTDEEYRRFQLDPERFCREMVIFADGDGDEGEGRIGRGARPAVETIEL